MSGTAKLISLYIIDWSLFCNLCYHKWIYLCNNYDCMPRSLSYIVTIHMLFICRYQGTTIPIWYASAEQYYAKEVCELISYRTLINIHYPWKNSPIISRGTESLSRLPGPCQGLPSDWWDTSCLSYKFMVFSTMISTGQIFLWNFYVRMPKTCISR